MTHKCLTDSSAPPTCHSAREMPSILTQPHRVVPVQVLSTESPDLMGSPDLLGTPVLMVSSDTFGVTDHCGWASRDNTGLVGNGEGGKGCWAS